MNPKLNLDIQLATGTGPLYGQLPEGNEMEQSLPPSDSSTRHGTPQLTNCERMKAVTYDLRQRAVLIELQDTTISTLRIQGLNDDAVMTTLLKRLTDLEVKHQRAVSEISSIPGCDNPDCNVHNIPNCSPNKTIQEIYTLSNCSPSKSVQEYPPLSKTTAVKSKEKKDGFSSPPTRKLSKNKRTNSNPDLNFKINLSNKFNGLENLELTIEPVAETSTDKTAINLPSIKNLTGNNKSTQDDASTKKLAPPVMLMITLNFGDQKKTLTYHMPQLRSKMTGEYFKLYCDTFDQYHELNRILEELLKYVFYSITPKSERPLKVVIKVLPKDSKTLYIHNDLLFSGIHR
ncbi:hypothetical protein TNCV_2421711 [Trichonephila clavipes]|nr:hypothetical protein TNCV_2421711 [Trichonephila clavipes]